MSLLIVQNESNKFLLFNRVTKQSQQIPEQMATTLYLEYQIPVIGMQDFLLFENPDLLIIPSCKDMCRR